MRKFFTFIIILIQATNLYSQVKFEIIELNLSQLTANLYDEVYREGEEDGPYVYLKCALYNQSDNDISLHTSKSEIKFCFNYMGVDYDVDVINIPFTDPNSITIHSNEKLEFNLGTSIVLGTPLWEEKKEDYRITLLGLLPTLRVHYKDPNLNFYSSRICKVNILYY